MTQHCSSSTNIKRSSYGNLKKTKQLVLQYIFKVVQSMVASDHVHDLSCVNDYNILLHYILYIH